MTLSLHYGNAVSGAQRFERPELQAKLLKTLDRSGGVKMFGLRRIGKSTLRRFVIETLETQKRPVVFLDAQGLLAIQDLLAELFSLLRSETKMTGQILGLISKESPIRGFIEAVAGGTKTGERLVSAYWKEAYNGIRDALHKSETRPILIIDEFSLLLSNVLERDPEKGKEEVNQLLAAMREWREAGMKMLLTGSIGVTALSRKYDLNRDHLNDLLPFNVPELTEAEAREFIYQATAIPSDGKWTENHTTEFIKQSGVLYPSFLVKGLLEMELESPPPPDQLATIFAENVRPVLHEDFYNQFNKRFKFYGDIDKNSQAQLIVPALRKIMESEAAIEVDGIVLTDPHTRIDLAAALDMLVEDGFIHFSEDAEGTRVWLPASRLARLWWKRSGL